ncbi:MAG: FtsW/RodA/SpoVE family cell cycle protein [Oscillospiraceae bacterium]|nr:FtsW/RodA/SpoVE family cell cycle protein [Oscillospiraceae bacterium]
MSNFISAFLNADPTYANVFIGMLRTVAPALAAILLFRCARPLMTFRREPEIWAWLCLSDETKLPITHWENVIGRSKRSDIVINFPTVSRSHGVLTRYDDGSWTIADADSKDGIYVNGKRIRIRALQPEDVISIGGVEMTLQPISKRQEQQLAQLRTKASSVLSNIANVLLLTVFQLLCCLAFLLGGDGQIISTVLLGFLGIAVCQWLLLVFYTCIHRTSFEIETIAFFLCTLGMAVIASVVPGEAIKQLISIVLGLCLFLGIGWALRDLERAKKIRMIAAYAGVAFLLITLLFGQEYYGAKNWLVIGSLSLQPSELSKVCFVFVGASAMERIMTKRNLILFIAYSVVLCGCLALMNDFGTALIFFCAFLVIAYMRSGSVGTIALACTALVFAGVVALKIAPHALQRFSSWRHIWEDAQNAGYQQTRALMCMASGGLLGLGPGRGLMKHVFAADSDMAVATLSEEWGLIMFIMAVLCIIALAVFCVRSAAIGRSSFYTIGACTAASIMVVQTILNALGTVDVFPLTGVTFPFLSNGGSSMLCAWGLLAFIKAADTRQNASFAVRISKNGGEEEDE